MPRFIQSEVGVNGAEGRGPARNSYMSFLKALGVTAILCGLGCLPIAAQDCGHHEHHYDDGWNCDRHWRSNSQGTAGGSTRYDGNVQTVQGRIDEIVYLPGTTPDSGMVELRLTDSGQTTRIQLAPVGFLKRGGLILKEGDTVTVKGIPVSGFQGDLIVTTTLQKGDKSLSLRDMRGRPLW
jgi:hypothetical protein